MSHPRDDVTPRIHDSGALCTRAVTTATPRNRVDIPPNAFEYLSIDSFHSRGNSFVCRTNPPKIL